MYGRPDLIGLNMILPWGEQDAWHRLQKIIGNTFNNIRNSEGEREQLTIHTEQKKYITRLLLMWCIISHRRCSLIGSWGRSLSSSRSRSFSLTTYEEITTNEHTEVPRSTFFWFCKNLSKYHWGTIEPLLEDACMSTILIAKLFTQQFQITSMSLLEFHLLR